MPKKIAWKSKIKFSGLHLLLSLLIFLLVVAWFTLVLYPSFYFYMSGGKQGLLLMFSVDVVLGPLLTFLIFNPNKSKREIIFDLLTVASIQLAAFIYGLTTVYREHPELVVFYDSGTATALTYREVQEDERFNNIEQQALLLEGVKTVLYTKSDGKVKLINPLDDVTTLQKIDKLTRDVVNQDEEQKISLQQFEKQYGDVWVMTVIGKYTGAYIILTKDFKYLGKLGEKSMM